MESAEPPIRPAPAADEQPEPNVPDPYEAKAVIDVIIGPFFQRREMALAPPGFQPGAALPSFTPDVVSRLMLSNRNVRIDATTAPRGKRDRVIFVVIDDVATLKSTQLTSYLTLALHGAQGEARELLNEFFLVVPESFFTKSNLRKAFAAFSSDLNVRHRYDPTGTYPHATLVPRRHLACEIPANVQVPPHEIADADEIGALFKNRAISQADIQVIYSYDPAVLWLGGRPGQIVRITRDSLGAGLSINYRLVKYAAHPVEAAAKKKAKGK